MKTAFIVDSTASLSDELANHPSVRQLKLNVVFENGDAFTDTTDIQANIKFYERMDAEEKLPKTSQPEPGHIEEVVKDLINQGFDQAIFVILSGALSGTLQTAQVVAQNYEDQIDSYFIDSKSTSFITEDLLIQSMALEEEGMKAEDIQKNIQWVADNSLVYIVVENMDNFVKGGRITKKDKMIGNLLRIKPLLIIDEEGKVDIFEKVRTTNRVYKRFMTLFKEAYDTYDGHIKLAIAHANVPEEADKLEQMIMETLPDLKLPVRKGIVTPIIGTHGGSGAIGVSYIPQVREIKPFD